MDMINEFLQDAESNAHRHDADLDQKAVLVVTGHLMLELSANRI